MKYISPIFEGVFSLAIFIVCARVASTDFQSIVVAGLGLIYVTTAAGIMLLNQRVSETTLALMRIQLSSIKLIAKPEHEDELEDAIITINNGDDKLDDSKICNGIKGIFYVFIMLGSLYLVYVSSHV